MICTSLVLVHAGLILAAAPASRAADGFQIHESRTPDGIRFVLSHARPSSPAPTLFVFSTTGAESLSNTQYCEVGKLLSAQGFLCVSLDLPCHGQSAKAGEPGALEGWRYRLEQHRALMEEFTSNASLVLDHLIRDGYSDPKRIAACGTSRGGFAAFHFAAADSRIQCVAGFSPVTDLLKLREFSGMNPKHVESCKLASISSKLAERAMWLCIGNKDDRVDTASAIAFSRDLVSANVKAGKTPTVELHVMPSPGHQVPARAHTMAAEWFLERLMVIQRRPG